jgi:hypothetical protein
MRLNFAAKLFPNYSMITSDLTETPRQAAEAAARADRLGIRVALLEEVARRLPYLERCSLLSTEDFCRALLSLAGDDAVLRARLQRSTWSRGAPDAVAATRDLLTTLELKRATDTVAEAETGHLGGS